MFRNSTLVAFDSRIVWAKSCITVRVTPFGMKILSVAYPLFPVSADSAGGAEQILFLLERGLVGAGCQSVVVAAAGSRISGELVETPAASGQITDAVREQAQHVHAAEVRRALEQFPADLVHFHGLDFHEYVPAGDVPKLATLHLPLAWYPASIFELPSRDRERALTLCCVSETQTRTAPNSRQLPVVPNGVDVARYAPNAQRAGYLLWLGRICPEKGTDIALRVAHALDLPLMVAGPVHPFEYHQAYFSEAVQPRLDNKRQYIGPVGIDRKTELLSKARCVLIPSLAAETGSLVAMEALASGAPVIAYRSGALPEIVEHGMTGFIVDSEEEMAAAVQRTYEISSERCRAEALRRFDARRMVNDYLKLYRDLLASR
jgi:glycosyltransferase involved in cell wall biosynthesis